VTNRDSVHPSYGTDYYLSNGSGEFVRSTSRVAALQWTEPETIQVYLITAVPVDKTTNPLSDEKYYVKHGEDYDLGGTHYDFVGLDKVSDMLEDMDIYSSEGVYIVNGKSIRYSFSSVDDTPKFVIKKVFSDFSGNEENMDGLVIDFLTIGEEDRESIGLNYSLHEGSGRFWVFGDNPENTAYSSEIE
jgi:hypothetical protein